MIQSLKIKNFKRFNEYYLSFRETNVLVGPNNAGKSSILDAMRALAGAWRYAERHVPKQISVGRKFIIGYEIPENFIPINTKNIHTNYEESETIIDFYLNNNNRLSLIFAENGKIYLELLLDLYRVSTIKNVKKEYPINILIVPTLSPFEEQETILNSEYFDRWWTSRRSSGMFRNIWLRNKNQFSSLQDTVKKYWSGIDINCPEILDYNTRQIGMYYKEGRYDREIYLSGFGFQVWIQILTHLILNPECTTLIIDEPDIYLHPDLQRKLFQLLKYQNKQIMLATHSVEIINEADHGEIIVIDNKNKTGKRINDIEGLQFAIDQVGSLQNIELSKLSRGKKIVFFEGDDFRIIRRFASKLGFKDLAGALDITVIPIGGVTQAPKVVNAAWTFETILKSKVGFAALFDRDYRSEAENEELLRKMRKYVNNSYILTRKEIENYILVPDAINRALEEKIKERGKKITQHEIDKFMAGVWRLINRKFKPDIVSQVIANNLRFRTVKGEDDSTVANRSIAYVNRKWGGWSGKAELLPGKLVLAAINTKIQKKWGISLSNASIINCIKRDEVPEDFTRILQGLNEFCSRADH